MCIAICLFPSQAGGCIHRSNLDSMLPSVTVDAGGTRIPFKISILATDARAVSVNKAPAVERPSGMCVHHPPDPDP